jgi:hypothetical protein
MSGLKELRAMGALVSDIPVPKKITFTLDDGVERTYDIHVKRLSVGDHEKLFIADKDQQSRTAKLISEAITLGADGKERLPFKEAYSLHPSIASAMLGAFNEVNGAKKT